MVIDATIVTIDGVLTELTRQKDHMEVSTTDKLMAYRLVQEQLLTDTNARFDSVMCVIRDLQKSINQFTPEGVKEQIRALVSVDPLVPRADQFERDLKAMEDSLRKSEV